MRLRRPSVAAPLLRRHRLSMHSHTCTRSACGPALPALLSSPTAPPRAPFARSTANRPLSLHIQRCEHLLSRGAPVSDRVCHRGHQGWCFCRAPASHPHPLIVPPPHTSHLSSILARLPQLGSTVIGIQTKEGVVISVEKRVTSPLMEARSIEKIVEIDTHIGLSRTRPTTPLPPPPLIPPPPPPATLATACAMSGLTADSRTMIDRARVEAQNYWFTYNEPMPVESVTQAVCNLAMQFGEGEDAESGTMVSRAWISHRLSSLVCD